MLRLGAWGCWRQQGCSWIQNPALASPVLLLRRGSESLPRCFTLPAPPRLQSGGCQRQRKKQEGEQEGASAENSGEDEIRAVVAARSEGGDAARENASNRPCGVRCAGVRLHHRCGRCRGRCLGAFGCPLRGACSQAPGEALCLAWLLQAQGARAPVSAPPERHYLATFAGLERQHALPRPHHAGRVCGQTCASASLVCAVR